MQADGFVFFLIVIAVGYFAVKLHLVPDSAADALSSILLNVCFPAMLLNTFLRTDPNALLQTGLATVVVSLVFSLLPFAVSHFLLRRRPNDERTLFRYILSIGNTSFVCIPLLSLFLSDEQMLIVIVHGAVMDLLIWGVHHPLFLGSGGKNRRESIGKILASPCLIAVVLGIVLCICGAELPSFLSYPLDALEATVSPLSLLFIGMLICRYGLLSWRHSKKAVAYSLWRVLVYPCLVFAAIVWFLPLQTAILLAILFGSPTPISAVLWCKEYGRDTKTVVDCLIPSTVLYFAVFGVALMCLTNFGIL